MDDSSDCEIILSRDKKINRQASYIWFKVKSTQVQMIADRGLEIPDEEKFLLSYDPRSGEPKRDWEIRTLTQFVEIYAAKSREKEINFNSALSQVYPDTRNGINTVVVYLCRQRESTSITAREFTTKFDYYYNRYFVEREGEAKGLNMIFISEVSLNKKEKQVEKLHFVNSQFFLTEELVMNPTRHVFYFPHKLLTEEEREDWLQKNKLRPEQLSIIPKEDPIVKYFDWPKGGVVHIQRSERYLEMPVRDYPYLRVIK